ncbi:MAG: 23S rRNA (guanosine(2251)-2'-O)-methyltransferase RlmB [Oscillospiraceae bacterium]|nr:23S rRNA (guanosine(2251)-2'-O)-methyltransferase RlmB [Oscillospiraceae bacterium]
MKKNDFRRSDRRKDIPDNRKKELRRREEAPREDALPAEEPTGLIVGRNPVMEALKSGKAIDIIYTDPDAGGSISSITRIAKERGIVIKSVSSAKLSQMCAGASHQGVIASGACAEYVSVEDILAVSARKGTAPFIIICDEIEDPHNLGAIIRTAEAAGADGIIVPKRRSASLNATVYKTSAGAASWLPVARVANIPQTIDTLKQNGIWIFGTDAAGESYTKADLTCPAALVIGSEGFGMGRLVREKCDYLVSLPMLGKITSLNASVAAGIFMYEAVRQRTGAQG